MAPSSDFRYRSIEFKLRNITTPTAGQEGSDGLYPRTLNNIVVQNSYLNETSEELLSTGGWPEEPAQKHASGQRLAGQ